MALQYIESEKGHKKLVHDGYLFYKNRENGNKIYWKCDKYHKFKCRVRLTTENEQIVKSFAFNEPRHNHTIDAAEITDARKSRQMAKSTNDSPQPVISKSLEDGPTAVAVPKQEFSQKQIFKTTPHNATQQENNVDPQRNWNELVFPDEFTKYLKFIVILKKKRKKIFV